MHATGGTGTVQPHGYLPAASLGVTGGTALPPTYDDMVDMYMSVITPYRANSTWLANDQTIASLRKIKSEDSGMPLLATAATGTSFTIFGRPVVSDPNLPNVASGAKSLVFGDISRYFVRVAGGIRFERSDDCAFDKDLVTFRALARMDGVLVDQTGAVKYYASDSS